MYGEGSRDYQNALYGIVHLHLSAKATDSTPIIKERFAKRSDYLLFALFRKDIAFFINVVRHPQTLSKNNPRVSEWTSAELLKIIENNWPDILEKSRIQGVSLCDNEGNKIALTDEDVAELTVNGISTFIQGKQGLYMPRLGISSSGDNVNAVCTAQREIRNAEICQEHFLKHQYEIRTTFIKYLRKAGISLPDVFDFHYDHISALGKYFIVDRHTCAAYDVFSGDLYTYSPLPTLVLHKKRMGIEINSMPIGQRLSITSP